MKAEPILDLRKLIVRCIWVETVFSEIESSCAISLLDSPLLQSHQEYSATCFRKFGQ